MRFLALILLLACAASAEQVDPVYFDEEMAATELLKKGDAAAAKGEWAVAAEAWQRIVDEHPESVVQDSEGLWLPAGTVCRRRIAAMPAEAVREYAARYEATAARIAEPGTAESLRSVATRWFCTRAGADATERLGLAYMDEGAWEMAVLCWEEVAERHPDRTPRPEMLARLGTLYVRMGLTDRLASLSQKHGDLAVTVRGGSTTLAKHLAGVAASSRRERPAFSIGPDMTQTAPSEHSPVPRSVKWRLQLVKKDGTEDKAPGRNVWSPVAKRELQTYPVVHGESLLVNFGTALVAFDAGTGALKWRAGAPRGEGVERLLENVSAAFWMHRFYAVISGDMVVFNLFDGSRCRLHAYSLKGRILWSHGDKVAAEYDLTGRPLVWRNRIYVGAVSKEKKHETFLLAFDRASGEHLWTRFVATCEPKGNRWGGDMPVPCVTPVTAAGDSYLYVCSNNGAFAAVTHDGALVWATKYPRSETSVMWWMAASQEETWDLNPVVFLGRDVFFFASDGTHCCRLDGMTGHGWKGGTAAKAMQVVLRERCKHVVALDGDVATMVGQESKLYDIRKASLIRDAFDELSPVIQYAGRGLVTKDRIYVPNARHLRMYDRRFGTRTIVPWPEGARAGTLLMAGKTLLSVSPLEIVAFSEEEPPKKPDPPVEADLASLKELLKALDGAFQSLEYAKFEAIYAPGALKDGGEEMKHEIDEMKKEFTAVSYTWKDEDIRVEGDKASVKGTIVFKLKDGKEENETETFRMVKVDGQWKIAK